jgi:isoleucyl-tRNA synthetase
MSKSHKIKSVSGQPDFPALERELLGHWYQNGIVQDYLHRNDASSQRFSFQDGPITANNPMGVHHAWGRTYKDLFQRYKNMRGYKQRFQNGFDCQGLWVEVEVEKELGFRSKRDIEVYGVDKFVALCKERVHKFAAIQTEQSKRLGYFMDWENSYYTMSDANNYMIWHFLKTCHHNNWLYKGHDSVPWCPRCQTAISQHEMLTEDYKEVVHQSVYLNLPVVDEPDHYLIIWTTTPWTIPANIAVAVDSDMEYALVAGQGNRRHYVAHEAVERLFGADANVLQTMPGRDLVGKRYTAPFDDLPAVSTVAGESADKFHLVVATDPRILPITATEGTGLVHTAVSAGTEDFLLGKSLGLPMIPVIDDEANYLPDMGWLAGKNAKKHPELILDYLKDPTNDGAQKDWVFSIVPYKHRYPACWRCKSELVWKVADEWYISMDTPGPDGRTLRERMMTVAKQITWKPSFGLERELDWLTNMHDWLISKKNRYWGLALPIYECACGQVDVIGSREELKKRAVSGWSEFDGLSPHKPQIDQVVINCSACGQSVHRVDDVGNVWLDAGIVPYSTLVDPATGQVSYTTDRQYWQDWFPADFITESFPGQFKNWFYAMIAMSSVLEDTAPYKTVLGFASMLAEDGRPMHKSWGNSIEFNEGADQIGVDIMRWTFVSHSPERNLLFGYKLTSETKRLFHMILWNSYKFFVNYAELEDWTPSSEPATPPTTLDRWILTRLDETVIAVTGSLDIYDPASATASIRDFVEDLSTWYIRRSRDRVGPSASDAADRDVCYHTLYLVFTTLARLTMPIMPFISDMIYTNLTGERSVHLADWPHTADPDSLDKRLVADMQVVRTICELGNATRKLESIPVKQALAKAIVTGEKDWGSLHPDLVKLIMDELNVLNLEFVTGAEAGVSYDKTETPELVAMTQAREIIRQVQGIRKDMSCSLSERIDLVLPDWPESQTDWIKRKTLADNITRGDSIEIIRR